MRRTVLIRVSFSHVCVHFSGGPLLEVWAVTCYGSYIGSVGGDMLRLAVVRLWKWTVVLCGPDSGGPLLEVWAVICWGPDSGGPLLVVGSCNLRLRSM